MCVPSFHGEISLVVLNVYLHCYGETPGKEKGKEKQGIYACQVLSVTARFSLKPGFKAQRRRIDDRQDCCEM